MEVIRLFHSLNPPISLIHISSLLDFVVMIYDPSLVLDVPLSHALNARHLSLAVRHFRVTYPSLVS